MDNDNKQIIIERIWDDPAPVLGGEWTTQGNGRYKATQRGAIRLGISDTGKSIAVYFNRHSGRAGDADDVFKFIQQQNNIPGDFWDVLQWCAARYGVELRFSGEIKQKLQRSALAKAAAPSLIASLSENKGGKVYEYLTKTRGIVPDGIHYGELTPESLQRVKEALNAQGLTASPEDFKALGLTDDQAKAGYNLVLPYYHNGSVSGFIFRDVTGNAPAKYKYNTGLEINGFCDLLSKDTPAVIVEGILDALRLISAGVPNVIAMGAAKISETLAHFLSVHNIRVVTYVPDTEWEQGKRRTELIEKAIKAFQGAKDDTGNPLIERLYIAEIPTPEGVELSKYKIDADDYGKQYGADALRTVLGSRVYWWDYELTWLDRWGNNKVATGADVKLWEYEFSRRFFEIYNRCNTSQEREQIRQNISGATLYEAVSITPTVLKDEDAIRQRSDYANSIRAGLSELSRAVDDGANPDIIGDILAKMNDAQSSGTRDEWNAQITASFEDELNSIRKQDDPIETKWNLGTIIVDKKTLFRYVAPREQIRFYNGEIAVFVAPTSHGKTMILFQSALDLTKENPDKTFLYVSCEENNRQLLERALNVYLDIPTKPTGRDNLNNYCFIEGTRKRAIKAAICGDNCPPKVYDTKKPQYTPEHWENLSRRIMAGVERYGNEIRPRLKFIHTDASAESIAANIKYFVEQHREQGNEMGGVFVDYMQLLTSENKTFSRHDELKDICKALKECAKSIELPIIIAGQLNREAIRSAGTGNGGLDNITLSNIGEGADIERIAHDVFLLWQVDKTRTGDYIKPAPTKENPDKEKFMPLGERSKRIFTQPNNDVQPPAELKEGYLYVEQLKARDGKTGGWGLFPFDGERGEIRNNDENKMLE